MFQLHYLSKSFVIIKILNRRNLVIVIVAIQGMKFVLGCLYSDWMQKEIL